VGGYYVEDPLMQALQSGWLLMEGPLMQALQSGWLLMEGPLMQALRSGLFRARLSREGQALASCQQVVLRLRHNYCAIWLCPVEVSRAPVLHPKPPSV
jgi:hypothetical protein